jgi:hypothetical protein
MFLLCKSVDFWKFKSLFIEFRIMRKQKYEFFSEEEKEITEMLYAITPAWRKAFDREAKKAVNFDQLYSEAKKVYEDKGKEALVKYVKDLPDSTIVRFWEYLLGRGLKVRMDNMPEDFVAKVVQRASKQ